MEKVEKFTYLLARASRINIISLVSLCKQTRPPEQLLPLMLLLAD